MSASPWVVVLGAVAQMEERRRRAGKPPLEELTALRSIAFRFMPGQGGSMFPEGFGEAESGRMGRLLVDIEDAADALDVSVSTVKRLIAAGELPAVKVGGATRVRTFDLAGYVTRLAPMNGAHTMEVR